VSITNQLEKLLNGDDENKNLVVQIIANQVHPTNIIAILSMLESNKCYHWIAGTDVIPIINKILKDELPEDIYLEKGRYPPARLFFIVTAHDKFQSEENLLVSHKNYMDYCDTLKDKALLEIKKNDTRPNPDI
jgi:hypothetical protein